MGTTVAFTLHICSGSSLSPWYISSMGDMGHCPRRDHGGGSIMGVDKKVAHTHAAPTSCQLVMVNAIIFIESSLNKSPTIINQVLWVIWVTESIAQRVQKNLQNNLQKNHTEPLCMPHTWRVCTSHTAFTSCAPLWLCFDQVPLQQWQLGCVGSSSGLVVRTAYRAQRSAVPGNRGVSLTAAPVSHRAPCWPNICLWQQCQ